MQHINHSCSSSRRHPCACMIATPISTPAHYWMSAYYVVLLWSSHVSPWDPFFNETKLPRHCAKRCISLAWGTTCTPTQRCISWLAWEATYTPMIRCERCLSTWNGAIWLDRITSMVQVLLHGTVPYISYCCTREGFHDCRIGLIVCYFACITWYLNWVWQAFLHFSPMFTLP